MAALTAIAIAAAMARRAGRDAAGSESAVASARRCTRMMPPASVNGDLDEQGATVDLVDVLTRIARRRAEPAAGPGSAPHGRAARRGDGAALGDAGRLDAESADVQRRFWLRRAASPASARTAARRQGVTRCGGPTRRPSWSRPTTSRPASRAVSTAMPTASRVMRPDSDARRAPRRSVCVVRRAHGCRRDGLTLSRFRSRRHVDTAVMSTPLSSRPRRRVNHGDAGEPLGGIPDGAHGADRAGVTELGAHLGDVDVDGAAAGPSRRSPRPRWAAARVEDDARTTHEWARRSNSVAVRAISLPSMRTSWLDTSTVRGRDATHRSRGVTSGAAQDATDPGDEALAVRTAW